MISTPTAPLRLGLSALALLALPACASAQSSTVASEEPTAVPEKCLLEKGVFENREITEIYQIGRQSGNTFDLRLDCTNSCGSQYIRMTGASRAVADRMFHLALTAAEYDFPVSIAVATNDDGRPACTPTDVDTTRRETGQWIKLKVAGN